MAPQEESSREDGTKGERRERQQRALAAKGKKHNAVRWRQVQEAQEVRTKQGTPAKKSARKPKK